MLVIRSEGKILQQGCTAAVVLVWFALKHQHRPSKGGLYRTISIDETKGFVKQSKKSTQNTSKEKEGRVASAEPIPKHGALNEPIQRDNE